MKEIKIIIKLPNFQIILREIKRFLSDKKLELILLIIILGLLILWKVDIGVIIFTMIGSVLLLYGWESKIIIKSLIKAKQDITSKNLITILLGIILILLVIWKFSLEAIILWAIFFAFLFYAWDSRIVAGVVLAFLISCPILLIFERENIAEQMAIYAYYFLVMTVVLQIKEYLEESRN